QRRILAGIEDLEGTGRRGAAEYILVLSRNPRVCVLVSCFRACLCSWRARRWAPMTSQDGGPGNPALDSRAAAAPAMEHEQVAFLNISARPADGESWPCQPRSRAASCVCLGLSKEASAAARADNAPLRQRWTISTQVSSLRAGEGGRAG
ncbi:unnamed protein product, partial [Prorocentrum cordatum]